MITDKVRGKETLIHMIMSMLIITSITISKFCETISYIRNSFLYYGTTVCKATCFLEGK